MSSESFSIKRKYVLGLGNWLQKQSLYGRESRERTKFIDVLSEEVKENEMVRMDLVKKYARKDAVTNEPVVISGEDEKKHYDLPNEQIEGFNKEMLAYLDEEFVLPIEGNKERLSRIKEIVVNTQEKIVPDEAPEYDAWCEAFEKMEL